jgi:hypothetical protein
MNNSELAHRWANQSHNQGTGSSMFFEKERIYSYGHHFEIARIVKKNIGYGGVILYNSRGYSNSTVKHQNHVYRAIDTDAYKVFHISDKNFDNLKNGIEEYKETIKYLFEQAAKAKKHGDLYLSQASEKIKTMLDFIKEFNLNKDDEVNILEDKLNTGDLLSPEAIAKIKESEKLRIAKQLEKRKDDINDWLNGKEKYLNNIDEIFLRIKNDMVQTSYGAEVEIAEAKMLLSLIRSGKPVHGISIGYYTVNSYSNGILKIGCHKLKDKEINRFAAAQGW